MLLRTFGQLQLLDGDTRHLVRRTKALTLLAFVASARRPVRREELASLFWPDSARSRARHSLRQAIAELRRALGDVLESDNETVAVRTSDFETDVAQFRTLSAAAPAKAVALWQGDYLAAADQAASPALAEWLRRERAALRQLLGHACRRCVEQALSLGRWDEAEARATWWCRQEPESSDARQTLTEVLRAAGRFSAAAQLEGTADVVAPESRPSDFVGRAPEMARALECWDDARIDGGLLELCGDAGAGKSRFARELVRHVAGSSPGSLAVTLDLPATADPVALITALAPRAGRRLLLVLDGICPDQKALRAQIAAALPPRTLVVVAGQPDALAGTPLLPVDRRRRRITMGPLSESAAIQLICGLVPLDTHEATQLAVRLRIDTDGNPGRLLALARQLIDEGLVGPGEDQRWSLARGLARGPVPVPLDPIERVRRRVERMSREARRVVEALAVLGPAASASELAAVAAVSDDVLREALREAGIRRLVRPRGASPAALFSDALVSPVYAIIPTDRRRQLHRRAARALRRRERGDRSVARRVSLHRHLSRPRWARLLHEAASRLGGHRTWIDDAAPADSRSSFSG